MSIIRVSKTENYSVISNSILNDESISWKAKGILIYLLSKPDNWQVYIEHLKKQSTDGRISTANGIKELIESGYIIRDYKRTEKGRFEGYNYIVKENKDKNNIEYDKDLPISENPITDISTSENVQLVNTEYKQILNKISTDKHKQEELIKYEDNVYLSNKDYNNLISIYNKNTIDNIIIELDNYLTNNPKKKYKDHYKVLRVWLNRDTKKYPKKQIQEKSEFTEITEDQREKSRLAMQKALEKAGYKLTENN